LTRRWSEEVEYLLNGNALGLGHFGQNSVKRAYLERVVLRNRDGMRGMRLMKKPNVASLLTNDFVAQFLQSANQLVR
jgi:hypothetical protein